MEYKLLPELQNIVMEYLTEGEKLRIKFMENIYTEDGKEVIKEFLEYVIHYQQWSLLSNLPLSMFGLVQRGIDITPSIPDINFPSYTRAVIIDNEMCELPLDKMDYQMQDGKDKYIITSPGSLLRPARFKGYSFFFMTKKQYTETKCMTEFSRLRWHMFTEIGDIKRAIEEKMQIDNTNEINRFKKTIYRNRIGDTILAVGVTIISFILYRKFNN